MTLKDVTTLVEWGYADGEDLPLLRCICGAIYEEWRGPVLNLEEPVDCPACQRRFIWRSRTDIYEVV